MLRLKIVCLAALGFVLLFVLPSIGSPSIGEPLPAIIQHPHHLMEALLELPFSYLRVGIELLNLDLLPIMILHYLEDAQVA